MAIALVSGQLAAGNSGTGSLTLTLPNNPTLGNFVAVAVQGGSNNQTLTIKDSNSNSYTQAGSHLNEQSAVGGTAAVFYLPNTPSNATKSMTLTNSGLGVTVWAAPAVSLSLVC